MYSIELLANCSMPRPHCEVDVSLSDQLFPNTQATSSQITAQRLILIINAQKIAQTYY